MTLTSTKELFLSNKLNKQKFVHMLGAELEKYNCQVFHDTADADYTIAIKAAESAESIDTVLVGNDTDLLVLLLHHANHESKEIFFMPESRKNSKLRVWNIKEAKEKLGTYICKNILFLHALLGSDTTSRIYGFGKAALMKKIKSNITLKQSAMVFDTIESSAVDIATAGEKVMCILYNASSEESLNTLRYKRFVKKLLLVWPMSSLIISCLPLQHQNSIACACFTRFAIGKAITYHQMSGVGSKLKVAGLLSQQMHRRHQRNCSKLYDVIAIPTAAVKDAAVRSME